MKFLLNLMAVLAISQISLAVRYNVTCFYDTFSIQRGGKWKNKLELKIFKYKETLFL